MVRPWPKPISGTQSDGAGCSRRMACSLKSAVSWAITPAMKRPRRPDGLADCRAMNTGRFMAVAYRAKRRRQNR